MADKALQVGVFGAARLEMESWWDLVRTLRGGTEAMRRRGEVYLPRNETERARPERYAARLKMSVLFEAYDHAIGSLAEKPFQQAIVVDKVPTPLDRIERNADRCGTSLTRFAHQMLDDLIDKGMSFLLVDHVNPNVVEPDGTTRKMNLAEEDARDARPYFVRILPDNFIGGTVEIQDGREVVTQLRIRDWVTRADNAGVEMKYEVVRIWTTTTVETWERWYGTTSIDPADQAQRYAQGDGGRFEQVQAPTPHGYPDGIPLVVVYSRKLGPLFAKPPLMNLAWQNVLHWQSDSQQRWILAHSRAPILVGTGVSVDTARAKPEIGAGATFMETSEQANLRYVETSGAALDAGRNDVRDIEERMRLLSGEPLVSQARGSGHGGGGGAATATGEIRAEVKMQAPLQAWVEALEWGLIDAYHMAARWRNLVLPQDFGIRIFRDFAVTGMTPQNVQLMQADAREGRISNKTYLQAVNGPLYGDELDPDVEADLVAEQAPPIPLPQDAVPTPPNDKSPQPAAA